MENQAPQTAPITPQVSDSNPIQEPTPKKSKLIYIFWGMLVLLIVTIGATSVVYISKTINTKSKPLAKQIASTPSPTKEVDVKDLRTYTNKQYGFSFKYPKGYKLEKESDESISFNGIFQPGNQTIPSSLTVYIRPKYQFDKIKNCNEIEWKNNIKDICMDGEIESENFNNITFTIYDLIYGSKDSQSESYRVYQRNIKPNIEFVYKVLGGGDGQVPQIISTLKFIDSDQVLNMTDWKTYSSTEKGFSLKYPPTWTIETWSGDVEGVMRSSIHFEGYEGGISIPYITTGGGCDPEKLDVGGVITDVCHTKARDMYGDPELWFDFKGSRFSAYANSSNKNNSVAIKKILSTLKFTN